MLNYFAAFYLHTSKYMSLSLEENTIVSFESPYQLRDLCMAEENSGGIDEHRIDEQKFNIRMINSEGRREAASVLIKKNVLLERIFCRSLLGQ